MNEQRPHRSLDRCIGPFEGYCSSAGTQPTDTYVAAPLIAFGVAPRLASETLSRIVAFDAAEANFANVTQTNMVRVSSFNGLNGLLLGFDLLPQPQLPSELAPSRDDVACAEPLFVATRALLGTVDEQRFPIAPGQHLLCAYKSYHVEGPALLYGAMAVAQPEDRERNADLFMEDHGVLPANGDMLALKRGVAEALLDSVALVGKNLRLRYGRIFASVQCQHIPAGSVGCVLTAVPYIKLARSAVPAVGVEALARMGIAEWESEVAGRFLPNLEAVDTQKPLSGRDE